MSTVGEEDFTSLNAETQAIWEHNARWWDEQIGEGNAFQRQLVGPATERLLEVQPGQNVLDLACGNGVFARRLSQLGAHVLACDFSPAFLERARARTTEQIEYRLVDVTDRQQLLQLGEQRFDAAVCNMAIMDIATITPLLESLRVLLRPGGRFVFSVLHPCFNTWRSHSGPKRGRDVATRIVQKPPLIFGRSDSHLRVQFNRTLPEGRC